MKTKTMFDWTKLSKGFIKAVVYSELTPEYDKPEIDLNDKDLLAPYISEIAEWPNPHFIKKYRREIEDYFRENQEGAHLKNIAVHLAKMNYGGFKKDMEPEETLLLLRRKNLTNAVVDAYKMELLKDGIPNFETETTFTKPITLALKKASLTEVTLHPYQKEAVAALKKFFIDEDEKSGILMMPTGSGKTMTSAYFLLHEMASRGYEIVWLAHRHMLVEQAAEVLYRLAPLARERLLTEGAKDTPDELRMVCVSGMHASSHALSKGDGLVIGSVQSLCKKTEYLTKPLAKKVIIVVDEAHHTTAPTYRRIIKDIRKKRPDAKLLGLTATPVKYSDAGTVALKKLFDDNIIFKVPMTKLITDGTLAKPIHIPRDTNDDIEAVVKDEYEMNLIRRRGELTERTIEAIAKSNERNEAIIGEYMNNREKYGKTLIFALNGYHAAVLSDMLRERGVACDYVYSLNGKKENEAVIRRFRDSHHKDEAGKDDHIDVLVNINILTEGSDIPEIQTVFLTRPTGSDTLLMQMIGRGMRGVGMGGTETVNVVDFCGKWSVFMRWSGLRNVWEGLEGVTPTEQTTGAGSQPPDLIPIEIVLAVARGFVYRGLSVKAETTRLPLGWYNVIDDEGNDEKILVFDCQMEGFEAMKADAKKIIAGPEPDGKELLEKYFDGFGLMPQPDDLEDIADWTQAEKKFPELHTFDERDEIDPAIISQKLVAENLTMPQMIARINEIYLAHRDIIDGLYGNNDFYNHRIVDFMLYPKGVVPIGTRIEEVDKAFYHLSPEPFPESLDTLLDEVIDEQGANLGDGYRRPTIEWTRRGYKSYYAEYMTATDHIKINCILDSADIPRETMKYLIYHECLHQLIPHHGPEFRELEHRYPDFNEHDHFLSYRFPEYDKFFAM